MAISFLSPHTASRFLNFESATTFGIQKTSFLQGSKLSFAPYTSNSIETTARRWCFTSAKDPIDRIPKQFREENLKEGLMDNNNGVPEYLHSLSASKLDMFINEGNPARQLPESVPEGSNHLRHSGMRIVSSSLREPYVKEKIPLFYTGVGRKRKSLPPPPDWRSDLFTDRVVFLNGPISTDVVEMIVSQLWWLDWDDSTPIYLFINSTGTEDEDGELVGSLEDIFPIADVMISCKSKIYTINMGMAYGPAALLLSLGGERRRLLQPMSCTRLSLPSVPESVGSATDMWLTAKEYDVTTEIFVELLSKGTGKPREELYRDLEYSHEMTAQEAIDYGFADRILLPGEISRVNKSEKWEKPAPKDDKRAVARRAEVAELRAIREAQLAEAEANPQEASPAM